MPRETYSTYSDTTMFFCNTTSRIFYHHDDDDHPSNQQQQQKLGYYISIPCTGVIGNVFLSFVIWKTSTISGSTRTLLLNEQFACLFQNIFWFAFLVSIYFDSELHYLLTVFMLSNSSGNVCALLMFATSANLYFAICKGPSYSLAITQRRVVVLVVCAWSLCLGVGLAPVLNASAYSLDCNYMMFESTWTAHTFTRLTIFLTEGVTIWALSIYILVKIHSARNYVSARSRVAKKVKLGNFVCSLSIFFSATFVIANVTTSTLEFFTERGYDTRPQIYISLILNTIVGNLRPCFYLLLYKPMWETTKTLFHCRTNRVRNVTVLPTLTHCRRGNPNSTNIACSVTL